MIYQLYPSDISNLWYIGNLKLGYMKTYYIIPAGALVSLKWPIDYPQTRPCMFAPDFFFIRQQFRRRASVCPGWYITLYPLFFSNFYCIFFIGLMGQKDSFFATNPPFTASETFCRVQSLMVYFFSTSCLSWSAICRFNRSMRSLWSTTSGTGTGGNGPPSPSSSIHRRMKDPLALGKTYRVANFTKSNCFI